MKKGKLIIFSAPSGSGKTTIVHRLLNMELNLKFSISACSREKRENEVDGRDYFFLKTEDFKTRIKENAFLEWEEVYENHFYGTLKSEVEKLRNDGYNVVFDIDVIGGINLKNQFKSDALSIFIKAPSVTELEKRLRNRNTDSEEKIIKRIKKAEYELSFSDKFDAVVVNENLDLAVQECESLIRDFIIIEK